MRRQHGAPGFRGPILLITLSGLSAQEARAASATGALRHLERFREEADWAGSAIAPASWATGSVASVFTGLAPSLHGAAHPQRPWLDPGLPTLAEELHAAGFATHGFHGTPWLGPELGLGRGFAALRPLRRRAAERYLAALDGTPSFTWVEIPAPGLAGPLAAADRRLGRLLDALERSGRGAEAVVIVHSAHGREAQERRALPATTLARALIEVPLAIRLPARLEGSLRAPAAHPVGLDRLFATLLELAGERPPPAVSPSLLRGGSWPAVSELWFAGGRHELALHEEGHLLRWRCRFAPVDPELEEAWARAVRGEGSELSGRLAALAEAFRRTPACTEGEEWELAAWPAAGGEVATADVPRGEAMRERLRGLHHFPPPWSVAPPPVRPPLSRRQLRALRGWGLPSPES